MVNNHIAELEQTLASCADVRERARLRTYLKSAGGSAGPDWELARAADLISRNAQCLTYESGLRELRKQAGIAQPFKGGEYRPLTIKETVEAYVRERAACGASGPLNFAQASTCSSVQWERGEMVCTFVPVDETLIGGSGAHSRSYLLDLERMSCYESLRREQVVNPLARGNDKYHGGWLALLEGDGQLLERFTEGVFEEIPKRHVCARDAMEFYLPPVVGGAALGVKGCGDYGDIVSGEDARRGQWAAIDFVVLSER